MKTQRWNKSMSNILDLTVACPYDSSNPPFCPLYKARKLSPEERIMWSLRLPESEMENITTYHQVCLKCRSTGTLI